MKPSKKILEHDQFAYGVLYVGNGVVYLEGDGMINIMVFTCSGKFKIQSKSPHLKIVESDKKLMMYYPTHIKRKMKSLFTYVGDLKVLKAKVYNYNSNLASVKIKHYDNSWENFDTVWNLITDDWNDLSDKGINYLINQEQPTSRGEVSTSERGLIKFKKPTNKKTTKTKTTPKKITSSAIRKNSPVNQSVSKLGTGGQSGTTSGGSGY